MKIHEYQAKSILKTYGVPIQDGVAIKSMEEFDGAVTKLLEAGVSQFVIKSQIHAGGRGKGIVYNKDKKDEIVVEGGVKFFGIHLDKARDYPLLLRHQPLCIVDGGYASKNR